MDRLIRKLVQTGTTERFKGGGRPRTARTEDNIAEVGVSQEDQPGTHLSQRKISQNHGKSLGSVNKSVRKDFELKSFKRISSSRKTKIVKQKSKTRSRKLLDKFSHNNVKHIFFTDEKDFSLEVPKTRKTKSFTGPGYLIFP